MDETSKKVIRSEFFCFLCICNLGKDQVRVSRKSAVDIARLIKRALEVDVSLYSSMGGQLGIFWVGMYRPGLQIGNPF